MEPVVTLMFIQCRNVRSLACTTGAEKTREGELWRRMITRKRSAPLAARLHSRRRPWPLSAVAHPAYRSWLLLLLLLSRCRQPLPAEDDGGQGQAGVRPCRNVSDSGSSRHPALLAAQRQAPANADTRAREQVRRRSGAAAAQPAAALGGWHDSLPCRTSMFCPGQCGERHRRRQRRGRGWPDAERALEDGAVLQWLSACPRHAPEVLEHLWLLHHSGAMPVAVCRAQGAVAVGLMAAATTDPTVPAVASVKCPRVEMPLPRFDALGPCPLAARLATPQHQLEAHPRKVGPSAVPWRPCPCASVPSVPRRALGLPRAAQ